MKSLLLFLSLLFAISLFAQDKMMVSKSLKINSYKRDSSIKIQSIEYLPDSIQLSIINYLTNATGTLFPNLKFAHGQTIDQTKYLMNDTTQIHREWVNLKYDLVFFLQDTSIGINSYYIQLNLDKCGNILYSNWPRYNYSDKNLFKSRNEILAAALQEAQRKGFDTFNYTVDFGPSNFHDKITWIFKFRNTSTVNLNIYDVIEIELNSSLVLAVYRVMTSKAN